jgi:hypothetical protein
MTSAGFVPPTHKRKGYRRKVDRDPEDVIRVRLPLEPIITEEQHRQILEIVENKRKHWCATRAETIPRFTYRGYLFCGVCSRPLYTWAAQNNKDFYHCKANLSRYGAKTGGCANRHMSRHLLEPRLDDALVTHLTNRHFLIRMIDSHLARLDRPPDTTDLIRMRVETLQKQRKRVMDAFISLDIDHLEKGQRLNEIDTAIEALRSTASVERRGAFDPEQVLSIVQVFRSWSHLRMDAKREIMERLLPEIFVDR